MNTQNEFPKKFTDALSDIPLQPDGLYVRIRRAIDRRLLIQRSIFALAATLLLSLSGLQVYRIAGHQASPMIPEVAEELTSVSTYVNGDVCRQNENSYAYYEDVTFTQQ